MIINQSDSVAALCLSGGLRHLHKDCREFRGDRYCSLWPLRSLYIHCIWNRRIVFTWWFLGARAAVSCVQIRFLIIHVVACFIQEASSVLTDLREIVSIAIVSSTMRLATLVKSRSSHWGLLWTSVIVGWKNSTMAVLTTPQRWNHGLPY